MCLGIPMRVVEIEGMFAWCEGRNGRVRINTMLLERVTSGQWLLTFLGNARAIIDAEQAAQVNAALDALEQIAAGNQDLDRYFADLVGKEPQLPQFLRKG